MKSHQEVIGEWRKIVGKIFMLQLMFCQVIVSAGQRDLYKA